jgi:methyl-accepting chemotaxis protein
MVDLRSKITEIAVLIGDITETARGVNSGSHERKKITVDGLQQIDDLISRNRDLIQNFDKIYLNLKESDTGIEDNSREFTSNIEFFIKVIESINEIKNILNSIGIQIDRLSALVREIRDDTDEIFTLALNASIVSSKYSHTSGVFDILANKLDEMSNYINQNLDNIVQVVKPITDGISQLMEENSVTLKQIEASHTDLMSFPDTLGKQKESINKLHERANETDEKIKMQKKMLEEITEKFLLMDSDAEGSIQGSGNVIRTGESLSGEVNEILSTHDGGGDYRKRLSHVKQESITIWNNAQNVNQKSKSQLDFSISSLEFCDSIVSESDELRNTAKTFNELSMENSRMADTIAHNLEKLISQIGIIEGQIRDSNDTIQKFNVDYNEIDSIIEFLKNILKSMKIIGMLSRIESSRDPEEFQGFMTISENISELQDKIQNNIPHIEQNIIETHQLIEGVNTQFEDISSDFEVISRISNTIIANLKEISDISSNSEELSSKILIDSETLENSLEKLRVLLNALTEIVKKPIDGSAANVERGKKVETQCEEILGALSDDSGKGVIEKEKEAADLPVESGADAEDEAPEVNLFDEGIIENEEETPGETDGSTGESIKELAGGEDDSEELSQNTSEKIDVAEESNEELAGGEEKPEELIQKTKDVVDDAEESRELPGDELNTEKFSRDIKITDEPEDSEQVEVEPL